MTTHQGSTGTWHIEHNPKPIPDRRWDWDFWHEDFDGAPDAGDYRYGYAVSLEACVDRICEMETTTEGGHHGT